MFLDKYSMFDLPINAESEGSAYCEALSFNFWRDDDIGRWIGFHKYNVGRYHLSFKTFKEVRNEFLSVKRKYSKQVVRANRQGNFNIKPTFYEESGLLTLQWNWKYAVSSEYVDGVNFESEGIRYFFTNSLDWSPFFIGENGDIYFYDCYAVADPFKGKIGIVSFERYHDER